MKWPDGLDIAMALALGMALAKLSVCDTLTNGIQVCSKVLQNIRFHSLDLNFSSVTFVLRLDLLIGKMCV